MSGQEGKVISSARVHKNFAWSAGGDSGNYTCGGALRRARARAVSSRRQKTADARAAAIYDPILSWALKHRKNCMGFAMILLQRLDLALGLPKRVIAEISNNNLELAEKLPHGHGSEFMPPFE